MAFHLAAAVGVRLVVERSGSHDRDQRPRNRNGASSGRERQQKLVVVASTSEVYGKSTALPFREDADLVLGPPTKTRWGYATSKLIDEFLALGVLEGTPGSRHRRALLQHRRPETERSVRDGDPQLRPPGARRRSRSSCTATERRPAASPGSATSCRPCSRWSDEPRSVGEVFNIGNGAEVSIRELAERITTLTGSDSPIQFVPYHEVFGHSFEDMPRRVPDISKIQRLVGYKPKVQLDEILERVIEYWEGQPPSAERRMRVPRQLVA